MDLAQLPWFAWGEWSVVLRYLIFCKVGQDILDGGTEFHFVTISKEIQSALLFPAINLNLMSRIFIVFVCLYKFNMKLS